MFILCNNFLKIKYIDLFFQGFFLDLEVIIVKFDFFGGFGGFSILFVLVDLMIIKFIIKIDGILVLLIFRIKD